MWLSSVCNLLLKHCVWLHHCRKTSCILQRCITPYSRISKLNNVYRYFHHYSSLMTPLNVIERRMDYLSSTQGRQWRSPRMSDQSCGRPGSWFRWTWLCWLWSKLFSATICLLKFVLSLRSKLRFHLNKRKMTLFEPIQRRQWRLRRFHRSRSSTPMETFITLLHSCRKAAFGIKYFSFRELDDLLPSNTSIGWLGHPILVLAASSRPILVLDG